MKLGPTPPWRDRTGAAAPPHPTATPGPGLPELSRRPRQVPTLEPGVVVEAHPGQRGDLLTPQPRHPPLFAVGRHPGLRRGDPGPTAGQGSRARLGGPHLDTTSQPPARGRYCQYAPQQALPLSRPTLMTWHLPPLCRTDTPQQRPRGPRCRHRQRRQGPVCRFRGREKGHTQPFAPRQPGDAGPPIPRAMS